MNSADAEDTVANELRSRERQQSFWYTAMLTGVVSAAYMPLAYWGLDGIFLCIWIAAIGLALVHEFLVPAASLILLGILVSTRVELPLSTLQVQSIESPNSGFEPGDLVIPIAATFGGGIVLMAALAWAMTTMPDDVKKFIKSFDTKAHFSGLQAAQFSLFHLLGLMTVVCLAVAPIFYGGLAAGFSKSPLILLGGILAIYQRYGLAFGMLVILVFGYILF